MKNHFKVGDILDYQYYVYFVLQIKYRDDISIYASYFDFAAERIQEDGVFHPDKYKLIGPSVWEYKS